MAGSSVSHLDGNRFDLLDRMKEQEGGEEHEETEGEEQGKGGRIKQVAHLESFTFEIHTRKESESNGRVYVFRCFDEEETNGWVRMIDEQAKFATESALHDSLGEFERMRYKIGRFYDSNSVQSLVAVLITLNFLANATQSELLPPDGSSLSSFFAVLDDVFTIMFTIELGLNLISHWFWPFVSDGWSVFDFVIVSISLVAMIVGNLPGVKSLRLMRAFRVLRLFGRLQSLRQIITALTHSIIPVLNAFLIMLLVTSIYAILAVNFFSSRSPEYFGSFSRACFTLFQVCTGDGWATEIARPIFHDGSGGDGADHLGLDGSVALFFVSFIVIVGWTLLQVPPALTCSSLVLLLARSNPLLSSSSSSPLLPLDLTQVVVAVLLDNFSAAAEYWSSAGGGGSETNCSCRTEKESKIREKNLQDGRALVVFAIDPLLVDQSYPFPPSPLPLLCPSLSLSLSVLLSSWLFTSTGTEMLAGGFSALRNVSGPVRSHLNALQERAEEGRDRGGEGIEIRPVVADGRNVRVAEPG
eukprot:766775-Hanusia_phi.AAC.1